MSRKDHTVDHVELYFRDQYVGRADMWRLSMSLEDTCVYVGQKISLAGCVRATVGRIFIREKKVRVSPETRLEPACIFFSAYQLFAPPGHIRLHHAINQDHLPK